jgi:hypothetical protein
MRERVNPDGESVEQRMLNRIERKLPQLRELPLDHGVLRYLPESVKKKLNYSPPTRTSPRFSRTPSVSSVSTSVPKHSLEEFFNPPLKRQQVLAPSRTPDVVGGTDVKAEINNIKESLGRIESFLGFKE